MENQLHSISTDTKEKKNLVGTFSLKECRFSSLILRVLITFPQQAFLS